MTTEAAKQIDRIAKASARIKGKVKEDLNDFWNSRLRDSANLLELMADHIEGKKKDPKK